MLLGGFVENFVAMDDPYLTFGSKRALLWSRRSCSCAEAREHEASPKLSTFALPPAEPLKKI